MCESNDDLTECKGWQLLTEGQQETCITDVVVQKQHAPRPSLPCNRGETLRPPFDPHSYLLIHQLLAIEGTYHLV